MAQYQMGNVTVMVSDMEKAVRFYTETLGLALRTRYGNEWAEVELQGLTIGLHPASVHGPKPGAGGSLSIGLQVSAIEAAKQELEQKGVRFDAKINDDGGVRLAFFVDPDGNPLYLCEVKH